LTDYTPHPTTDKIVAEVSFLTTIGNGSVWCARGSKATSSTWTLFRIGTGLRFDYKGTTSAVTTSGILTDTRYTLTVEDNTFSWSGGTGGTSTQSDFATAGGPLMLFASYYNGTDKNLNDWSNHRLYSLKIYRKDDQGDYGLIHDFVPCLDEDGNATLYDDVPSGSATLTRYGFFLPGPVDEPFALRIATLGNQVFDGVTPCTPHPMVFNAKTGEKLTEGTHYTLSWTDNDAVGTATVTATGKAGTDYAGRVAQVRFAMGVARYVKSNGDATKDGTGGWANATTLQNAFAVAASGDTLRLQAGTYSIGAVHATDKPLTIQGGYAGLTDDSMALADDPVSTLDGGTTIDAVLELTAESGETELQRLVIKRSKKSNLIKTGAGNLTLRDCRSIEGGWHRSTASVYGYGLNATGTASTYLTLTNCVFADNGGRSGSYGNRNWGGGAYFKTFRRVTMDDCHFLTNGIAVNMVIPTSYPVSQEGGYGWAFAADGAPITMRNSTIIGNRGTQHSANTRGIVQLEGDCGGSAFTNCLFAGNSIRYNANSCGASGTLGVNLDSAARTVDIEGCTFAYNLINAIASAAGVTVATGAATIRNSVFFGNAVKNTSAVGADLHVGANGTVDVDYCFFRDETEDCITSVLLPNLTCGSHNRTGDPLFVTPFSDITPMAVATVTTASTPAAATFAAGSTTRYTSDRCYYGPSADFSFFDLHLRSGKGRWSPAAADWVTDEATSTAIDGGDPASDCSNEPSPNGGIVNMGFYGNTTEASKSSSGRPAFGDISVVQDRDYTQPFFCFSLGGDEDYAATVTFCFGTTDGGEGEWQHTRVLSAGANRGVSFDFGAENYFDTGDTVYWKAVAVAAGGSAVVTGSTVITGEPPPWKDVPPVANVIYVRPGAMCRKDGSSWADACATPYEGFLAFNADATKTEIWIAGTNTLTAAISSAPIGHACMIRGGFRGWETAVADRVTGLFTVLDGTYAQSCLAFANTAPVEIERILFTRAKASALVKTGGGDLTVHDCRFYDNHDTYASTIYGFGLNAQSGSSSQIVVKDCVFDRNAIRTVSNAMKCYGCAIYVKTAGRLTVDDTLFLTNGCLPSIASGSGNLGGMEGYEGSVLYAESVPVTMRGCRFVGNRGTVHAGSGSTVYVTGASQTCAFTNCAWIANESRTVNWRNDGHANAGALTFSLSANTTPCEVVNCTFAYGLFASAKGSGGLNVIKGAAKVRNSIFYGNLVPREYKSSFATTAADVFVGANATADIGWTLFAAEDATFSRCTATGGSINEHDCVYGDPLFVTPFSTMTNVIASTMELAISNTYHVAGRPYYKDVDYDAFNVHLRHRYGYTDEFTGLRKRDRTVAENIAVDAGEPASDYSREPVGRNGRRINLGCYGNTPYATCSAGVGTCIIIK